MRVVVLSGCKNITDKMSHDIFSGAYCKLTQDEGKLEEFVKPIDNIALWSALYYGQLAPFVNDEMEAFGFNQPGVRRSAWAFLFSVLKNCRSTSDRPCRRKYSCS